MDQELLEHAGSLAYVHLFLVAIGYFLNLFTVRRFRPFAGAAQLRFFDLSPTWSPYFLFIPFSPR